MTKSTTKQKTRNTPLKRRQPKRPVSNFFRRIARFLARVPWSSVVLRFAALAALVVVEAAVAVVVGHLAGDQITQAILVSTALLGGLGVVLGPSIVMSMRQGAQRKLAWLVVIACLAVSGWNLSTTLANAQALSVATAIRSADTYESDKARRDMLNRRIDAMADEPGADATLAVYAAERDLIQARIDQANPAPIMFAWENDGIIFWIKAFLFHGLVAGFSAAFAMPMRKQKTGKRGSKRATTTQAEEGEVAYLFGKPA